MAEVLGIDIETFSDVSLPDCGVHRYVASKQFEILLFAYSLDGGKIHIIDLASGETISDEILGYLKNDSVIKTAFNASFERNCLNKHFGLNLKPEAWRCTAVQAAMLALPLSLEGVGEALNLDKKKMAEGKDLVRYFCLPCKPTKTNGSRTRNRPEDAPEKWEQFKAYCIRDVAVEMQIREKLKNYPIPDREQELYCMDQRINDRGIMVDIQMVERAIACDLIYKETATKRAYELSGLENPNSVPQLKGWLTEQGIEADSLARAAVEELVDKTDGDVSEMLKLRLSMSKTSVKKYEAMERCVCPDGRVHGLLQFYGANRTGRWCLTGDHEVLTSDGWVRFDEWSGGAIACWSQHGEIISFQKANAVSFDYEGEMYEYDSQRISQVSTPDHKMISRNRNGEWEINTVEELSKCRPAIPFTGRKTTSCGMEHLQVRIMIMTQADGHYCEGGDLRFHFSKQRKIERCKSLLRKAEILFVVKENKDTITISIKSRHLPLWLRQFRNKTFGAWILDESADIIFDELAYWDAYRCGPNSIQYGTINKQNADMIQALAHLSNRAATIKIKTRKEENWNAAYIVNIWLIPGTVHEIRKKPTTIYFKGKVYCAETKTGFFMVRRSGKVWITGNSGRNVQIHNLPQNHMPDLELARSLVKEGRFDLIELLYDSIPDVLSELIRTAFIAKPDHRFIVSDFSAIEARVMGWLAGERWVLEEFRGEGKIYEQTASKMFHIPMEEITKGSPYRARGKVASLACQYGGAEGALTSMGALNYVEEGELKGLVTSWRNANPHIVNYWYEVDAAAKIAVKEHKATTIGRVSVYYHSGMMMIRLPSGRELAYVRPKMTINRFGSKSICYQGIGLNKKWSWIESYGAKLCENIVQAVARDLLAEAMLRLEKAGFSIVCHVHDEVVLEVPEGESSVKEVNEIMAVCPGWADGLPLKADGFESPFYKKD